MDPISSISTINTENKITNIMKATVDGAMAMENKWNQSAQNFSTNPIDKIKNDQNKLLNEISSLTTNKNTKLLIETILSERNKTLNLTKTIIKNKQEKAAIEMRINVLSKAISNVTKGFQQLISSN